MIYGATPHSERSLSGQRGPRRGKNEAWDAGCPIHGAALSRHGWDIRAKREPLCRCFSCLPSPEGGPAFSPSHLQTPVISTGAKRSGETRFSTHPLSSRHEWLFERKPEPPCLRDGFSQAAKYLWFEGIPVPQETTLPQPTTNMFS